MDEILGAVRAQTMQAAEELLASASPGQVLVVGCSTSEVLGQKIGSAGSQEVAKVILGSLLDECHKAGVNLAVQCCEHLNRALVVERSVMQEFGWEQVSVVPVAKAGGALAAQAMSDFSCPVVIEEIKAHAGLDIGCTFIGMHLKAVAVPVRLQQKRIGQAIVTAARTRPKLIGGARAVY
jgi:uncharacterized protein (TIGR01440 family)